MKTVPDALLLTTAEISATLIGLLLVAVFFYLETGFRRLSAVGPVAQPFLKATAQLIVLQSAMVLGLSLGLVALDPPWVTIVYGAHALGVATGLVIWSRRAGALSREVRRALRIKPWLAWPIVLGPLGLAVRPRRLGAGSAGLRIRAVPRGRRGAREHGVSAAPRVRPRCDRPRGEHPTNGYLTGS